MYPVAPWRVLVAVISCASPPTDELPVPPPPTLADVPHVKLADRPAATEEEANTIRALIRDLADVSAPDYGYSTTYSGSAFAPIEGTGSMSALILMRHETSPSEPLKKLVALGPKALPLLLHHLTDDMPTKLTVQLPFPGMGGMWFGHEIRPNPVNEHEAAILKHVPDPRPLPWFTDEREIPEGKYTLTVGDICFVAIGQITNRVYSASRYQMTGCIVVNSPVRDPELASEVRAIWRTQDHHRALFDSLMIDFYTRGSSGNDFQVGAALRLLYYFPHESTPLIVNRLRELDVVAEDYKERMKANGVRVEELVEAISWTSVPEVREALLSIMAETTHVDTLVNCLPAATVEHDDFVFNRLKSMLAALPDTERYSTGRVKGKVKGPYGDGYKLLRALGDRFPHCAKPIFQEYLRDASEQRLLSMCMVLRETRCEWAPELLAPLLDDKIDFSFQRTWRVCDEAAKTLAICDSGKRRLR